MLLCCIANIEHHIMNDTTLVGCNDIFMMKWVVCQICDGQSSYCCWLLLICNFILAPKSFILLSGYEDCEIRPWLEILYRPVLPQQPLHRCCLSVTAISRYLIISHQTCCVEKYIFCFFIFIVEYFVLDFCKINTYHKFLFWEILCDEMNCECPNQWTPFVQHKVQL